MWRDVNGGNWAIVCLYLSTMEYYYFSYFQYDSVISWGTCRTYRTANTSIFTFQYVYMIQTLLNEVSRWSSCDIIYFRLRFSYSDSSSLTQPPLYNENYAHYRHNSLERTSLYRYFNCLGLRDTLFNFSPFQFIRFFKIKYFGNPLNPTTLLDISYKLVSLKMALHTHTKSFWDHWMLTGLHLHSSSMFSWKHMHACMHLPNATSW